MLTKESISRFAPSVFAEVPHARVSSKYSFLPTSHVVDLLEAEGWEPVKAVQSRVHDLNRSGYQRHMLRFRHRSEKAAKVGDSIPELVLLNSHDGSSAYQLSAGLFRLVCGNGLVVADSIFARISIRHAGFKAEDVIEASYRVLKDIPKITASVEWMRSVTLTEDERTAFAESALKLKYPDRAPIEPRLLLLPRRREDREPNLWATLNVCQENLIRGGLAGRSETNRRIRTRPVQSIAFDVSLNKRIWELAEQTRIAKSGSGIRKAAA